MLLRQSHSTRHRIDPQLPLLVEALLAHLLNLAHTLHGLQRLGHQLAVVLHRAVARLLELERGVLRHYAHQPAPPTTRMSFPFARRKAFVQRTFRGFRLRLKFFRHFERQKRNTYIITLPHNVKLLCCRCGRKRFHVRDKWDWSKSSTFLFSFSGTIQQGGCDRKKEWRETRK